MLSKCGLEFCDLSSRKMTLTIICENNVACIVQLKDEYTKAEHIIPKFISELHDLHGNDDINNQ